jgi:hypothetical protein
MLLSKATCKDAGRHEIRGAMNLVESGRRLAFAVKVRGGSNGEYPRLHAAG